ALATGAGAGACARGVGTPFSQVQEFGFWKQLSTWPALCANESEGSARMIRPSSQRISESAVHVGGELRRQADHDDDRLAAPGLAAGDDVVVRAAGVALVGAVAGELAVEAV